MCVWSCIGKEEEHTEWCVCRFYPKLGNKKNKKNLHAEIMQAGKHNEWYSDFFLHFHLRCWLNHQTFICCADNTRIWSSRNITGGCFISLCTDDSCPLLDALRKCTLQHSVNVNLFSSMSVLYWPIQVLQFIHVPCIITFSHHEITITDVPQRWQTANPSLIYTFSMT